ncbi:MAG: autotransporter outer membrane beta-barrel domain-containing protein [Gammaproteobacteria bacterium]|nr:autotransporter outer membrane beta-barrel domain-containing protein [Gammaproteobacteria bacterium]
MKTSGGTGTRAGLRPRVGVSISHARVKSAVAATFPMLLAGAGHAATLGELPGQTQLQSNTGNGIATVCAGFDRGNNVQNPTQQSLFDTCRSMVQNGNQIAGSGPTSDSLNLPESELNGAIQNAATEEIAMTNTVTTRTSNGQVANIMGRISELTAGGGGFSIAQVNENGTRIGAPGRALLAGAGQRGGAASADDASPVKKLGGFVNLIGSFGEKDQTAQEDGFDFNTIGITAGVDYRFTDNVVAGAALGYTRLNSSFTQSTDVSGGDSDANGYGLALFGLYYLDRFNLHGIFGYSRNNFDLQRSVVIPSNNPNIAPQAVTAESSPDSNQFYIAGGVGYDIDTGAWNYGPFLDLRYLNADIDGYTETGAGGLNLQVDSQDFDSLQTVLGFQGAYAMSQSFGVLQPYLRAAWHHEFLNDSRTINSQYVNEFIPVGGSPTLLPVVTEAPDRNWGTIGVGLSSVFQGGWQGYFLYERWVGLEYITDNVFSLGVRGEF